MLNCNPNATSVQVFNFNGTLDVQIIMYNGDPYFIAVDICNVLCLSNPTKALYGLDNDEHLTLPVVRSGQKRTVNVVNESGLYALIFQSRKPVAKKFRKWVTSEVLPSIRKTGYYGVPPENTVSLQEYRHLEMMLGVERKLRELLQKQRDHYVNEINYYVNERDDWRNRALERSKSIMQMIVGIA